MTESGDGQAVVTAAASDPSAAISAYNDGGTMYFYSGDDMVSKKIFLCLKKCTIISISC